MLKIIPRRGDYGTTVIYTVKDQAGNVVDLSSATALKLYVSKPDGSETSIDGSFVTDGTDGQMMATLVSGVLSIAGHYEFEPVITFSNGEWSGSPRTIVEIGSSLRAQ